MSAGWDETWITRIPMLSQRQGSTLAQVLDLHKIANRIGLYDAADWIIDHLGEAGSGRDLTSGEYRRASAICADHTDSDRENGREAQ